jgi:hypothetical protein
MPLPRKALRDARNERRAASDFPDIQTWPFKLKYIYCSILDCKWPNEPKVQIQARLFCKKDERDRRAECPLIVSHSDSGRTGMVVHMSGADDVAEGEAARAADNLNTVALSAHTPRQSLLAISQLA